MYRRNLLHLEIPDDPHAAEVSAEHRPGIEKV
jgi:hypothetical protein